MPADVLYSIKNLSVDYPRAGPVGVDNVSFEDPRRDPGLVGESAVASPPWVALMRLHTGPARITWVNCGLMGVTCCGFLIGR
jgi:hypothetical protein